MSVLCRWGCKHEKEALETYRFKQAKEHHKLQITDSGLFISTERPYIGASPDAIVTCECCGKGVVEIKCPFCFKEELPADDNPSNFCMTRDTTGELNLPLLFTV